MKSIIPEEAREVDCCFPNMLTWKVDHQLTRIRGKIRQIEVPTVPSLLSISISTVRK